MTKREQVKNFIDENKGAIATIGTAIVGLASLALMMKGVSKPAGLMASSNGDFKAHDIASAKNLAVGELMDFWQESPDFKNMIVRRLTMADIGKLGESIVNDSGVESITMETPVALVLDIFDNGTQW